MRNPFEFFKIRETAKKVSTLADFWPYNSVTDDGLIISNHLSGFMFEATGLDVTFLSSEQLNSLHNQWRTGLRFSSEEEIQIIFRKRVEFAEWVEDQISQVFLADNSYGRKILLDRLSDQVVQMSGEQPKILSEKIIICFNTTEKIDQNQLRDKRSLFRSQMNAFGISLRALDRVAIEREINISANDLSSSALQTPEWPSLKIEAGNLKLNEDRFRALELVRLPESFTELGMLQAITDLPYPMDICVRLKARANRPIVSRLERKRNLLNSQKSGRSAPSPDLDSQLEQIDRVLRNIADSSDSIFDLKMTIGLRFAKKFDAFHRKALAEIMRSANQMDFCELEESTLSTFDSYLECVPGFSGRNIRTHTILSSNAIHFLPLLCAAKGDRNQVITFQTKKSGLYGIDPTDSHLANYNWLVSGTSGAGKSFFVNSLLVQSSSINPNVFIVDIGGSYNKLTQFLGGKVMSLEPGQGFEFSPFFLGKSEDEKEERMRRQHIYQIFLEMTRVDGQLPGIEIRHLLSEKLNDLFDMDQLPDKPISYLIELISKIESRESRRLVMLLRPWSRSSFCGQFLDNNKVLAAGDRILTFDLKGLTEFQDLSRVVQLIICASLWARIRQTAGQRFSWIVLDEVAFSLLKTQSEFVDELVSTLRKYFGGAIIVVQDLEKVTSNFAGSSILQNTQSKAILQQRGDPEHYSSALSLNRIDLWAIESLRREKGAFSDIFLLRDNDRVVIRHVPSALEYWLATTAPEDNQLLAKSILKSVGGFQRKIIDFAEMKKGSNQ